MGLSVNRFTYAGSTDFDLNFARGYNSQSDIECYFVREGTTVNVEFDWLTDTRVRVDDTDVELNEELIFTRTVSKESLPVDLTAPGNLTREAVSRVNDHLMYIMHEVLDGRVASFSYIEEISRESVADLITAAVENTDLLVEARYPMIIQGSLAGPIVSVVPKSVRSSLEEVSVSVRTYPTVPIEFILTDAVNDVLEITLYPDGTETVEVIGGGSDFTLNKGSLLLQQVSGNYYDGDIAVGVNGVDSDILSTTEDFPDFLVTYIAARTL